MTDTISSIWAPPAHDVTTSLRSDDAWYATCTCGWYSEPTYTEPLAKTLASQHHQTLPTGPAWQTDAMPTILAGLAAMVVGLFMPWLTLMAPFVGQISRSGLDTEDGKLIAVALLVLGVLALNEMRSAHLANRVVIVLGAAAIGIVIGVDYNNAAGIVSDINGDSFGRADIGFGMYLTGFGAAVTFAGVISRLSTLARR